ncbi:MAG: hypothetical protein ACYC8T_26630 [Myxococcaceae bacterium]
MKLHVPSFLFGFAAGAATALAGKRFRPVLVEIATGAVRFLDALAVRLAIRREDVEDLWAEARARARTPEPAVAASP